ncbi:hypothetical protein [Fluviicola sp.]|uniref:hypothetical protein n=1 Tax=Fluviicola sp. TaxID=1917219 RepID=UPI0031E3DA86
MKKLIILSFCVFSLLACTKKKFTGTYSFWYNTEVANDLSAYGITSLSLYVDEQFVKTIDASKHYTGDPGCGTGNFVYEESMFKKENRTHYYKIYDQTNSLIWHGPFMMSQKECNSLQLTR